ncbi:DUF1093 domain-containing protein [Enterococcus faecium]|uniref:DUF1093 domain-containing protein n=1 Tax=Enterococcus faecium TaxID=1352 RepID=UPI000BF215CF|nr:DUF1093 domain-containing protein [Enterococcus faecium]PEH49517.1 hypothetical protein CRM75_01820 [Enterococcus faecium]
MKKNSGLIIIGVIVLAVMGVFGYKGYQYYNDTYNGVDAYAYVSEKVPQKEPTKNADGKLVSGEGSYKYPLEFVKKDGTTQLYEYERSGESDTVTPLEPGSLIKVKLSKKRIVKGPTYVSEKEVPSSILEKLIKQKK